MNYSEFLCNNADNKHLCHLTAASCKPLATSKRKKYEQEKETGYILIQKRDASISK